MGCPEAFHFVLPLDGWRIPRIMSFHPRLLSLIEKISPSETISLALGELFPLTEEQLRMQWHELVKDSPLASSDLKIHIIPAEQQCMVCFQKYHPANRETACPYCKSMGAKILAGEELYMEIDGK